MSTALPTSLRIATPSDRHITITIAFDAPRGLVFDALTRPELLERWLSAPGRTLTTCKVDLRAGGHYRLVWSGEGRSAVEVHGVCREIARPDHFTCIECRDDRDTAESALTALLVERDGATLLTATRLFASGVVRDDALNAGLEHSLEASFARLADLLACRAAVN